MTERERLAELAKRRGLFFPANESYGGTAGFYVYGPSGARVKENISSEWRDRFSVREGHMEIDSPTVMPEAVFDASGHLDGFDDMLVVCPECGATHRADHLIEDATELADVESRPIEQVGDLLREHDISCPRCGRKLGGQPVEEFNLMFETNIGPGGSSPGYLRPETAQGIFVEFPRLVEYARGQLPFGVTQVGTAYRNEISPRRGLVRLREFTQAELELFIDPEVDRPDLSSVGSVEIPLYSVSQQEKETERWSMRSVADAVDEGVIANEWIAYYLGIAYEWFSVIGIDMNRFRFRQHLPGERAHYAADCWDAEVEIDGDWIEVTGFAYRSSYDLTKHGEHSDAEYTVFKQYDEPTTVERARVDPDMSQLGPRFGDLAPIIATELEALATRDPTAFEADTVTVSVQDDSYEVPVEHAGFSVEEETITGEHIMPHVVEPSFGIDRIVYAVLAHSLREDELDGEPRTVLGMPPAIAPTFVGVFPLMDRDGLGERAREIAASLRAAGFSIEFDDSGSIGRRYRRQDEVGTPFCVTIDYETLDDGTVTLRDRDTADQRRVAVDDLEDVLMGLRRENRSFEGIEPGIAGT